MIIELIPAVQQLTPEQKFILAGELCREAMDHTPTTADADIRRWLAGEWEGYLQNPEQVTSWDNAKLTLKRA